MADLVVQNYDLLIGSLDLLMLSQLLVGQHGVFIVLNEPLMLVSKGTTRFSRVLFAWH